MADYEVVIIGAGPGGYVAAIRAAQLGFNTAIIERDTVGGICLNWGCIPSKSLLRNAEVLNLIKDANEYGISFDNLNYDYGNSRDALELREVPRRIVIVGGGATGVEFSHVYRSYGSEVTIVELMDRLIPNEDEEISASLEKSFSDHGVKSLTGVSVNSITVSDGVANVNISSDGTETNLECDKVLVAVGVQGNSDGIGLENTGVTTDRGFIPVGENMETNVSGIYAIGDVTGKMLLAHVASAQAVVAVEYIAGLDPEQLDYSLMPRAIYCKPQVASFGLSEAQARDQGIDIKVGKFPFSASGKAIALGETDGMVKLIVDQEIGEIIGAHMIGAEVTELLGELSITKMLEGTATEIGLLVHPHPTISEMVKEAALDTMGEAIHI